MDSKAISSTVQTLSPSRKEVSVEISAEETAKEYRSALDRLAARVKISGFRQGRVPRDMVQKRFSAEVERAVIDDLAPEALRSAFREHSLEPVGIPILKDIEFSEGRPLRFRADIDVWPEFDLSDYRKIRVTRKDIKVEAEEVDRYLEQLRQRSAEYVPVQGRAVVQGDYVAVEVQGQEAGTKKKLPLEKSVLLAGPSEDQPLSERIIGLSEGDTGRIEVSFPAGQYDKKLAGKTMTYLVKILAIKEKKVPALDDDLAKTLGDFADLGALRQRVQDDLRRSKERSARGEAAEEILAKLSEQVPDDLPQTLVEQETQDLLRKFLQSPGSQGFEAGNREAVEDIKKRMREQARKNLKNHMVLKKVAARETLTVSEDEVEEEVKILAQANRVSPAGLRGHLEEEGRLEGLRESLLFRKTVDFLVNKAIMNS